MATQVMNYQCPACTGPLQFSAASGKLECEYCGSVFEAAEIEAEYAAKEEASARVAKEQEEKAQNFRREWDTSGLNSDWGADAEGMRTYNCPSCGAELICDLSTAATSCPYCGNPSVVPGQFSGALRPDFVIPFKVQKSEALDILKAHCKGKIFLPGAFRKEHVLEKVQGIYVPFWLFDGKVQGRCIYDATRVLVHRTSSKRTTITRHFEVVRAGEVDFSKVPVDASRKLPDAHMDSLEPFDYNELKPFSSVYLPGFLADKFDVSVDECSPRADLRCENTFVSTMRDTVRNYDMCSLSSKQVSIDRGEVHYALLPVWMLSIKWKDKVYQFAINGQTGKLAGDLPMAWSRVLGLFASVAVPLGVIGHFIVRMLLG